MGGNLYFLAQRVENNIYKFIHCLSKYFALSRKTYFKITRNKQ